MWFPRSKEQQLLRSSLVVRFVIEGIPRYNHERADYVSHFAKGESGVVGQGLATFKLDGCHDDIDAPSIADHFQPFINANDDGEGFLSDPTAFESHPED